MPAELVALRALLDRSTETATPAVADRPASPPSRRTPGVKAIGG
jgi:hypothetical protein